MSAPLFSAFLQRKESTLSEPAFVWLPLQVSLNTSVSFRTRGCSITFVAESAGAADGGDFAFSGGPASSTSAAAGAFPAQSLLETCLSSGPPKK